MAGLDSIGLGNGVSSMSDQIAGLVEDISKTLGGPSNSDDKAGQGASAQFDIAKAADALFGNRGGTVDVNV
jgi:hypothetical protein